MDRAFEKQMLTLYEEQQTRYVGNFKNKHDEIRQQYDEFWSHPSAIADVAAYLDQTPGHIYNTLPKWVEAKTAFTGAPNVRFAENELCAIIGNRASFDVAQYPDSPQTAGMSIIHLLAIPKANIYNGVSLTPENVFILDEMVRLFRTSWPKEPFQQAMLEHQRLAIEQVYQSKNDSTTADRHAYQLALRHLEELKSYVSDLSVDDFQYGLHLYPEHSVSHLHMHIIAMPRHMRKYSTTDCDDKTKDMFEVRDFILSMK